MVLSQQQTVGLIVSGLAKDHVDRAVTLLVKRGHTASRGFHQASKTARLPLINVFTRIAMRANVIAIIRQAIADSEGK